jgi:prepilin-type N-terminal cleavage/methylation domain-containing protein
MSRKRGFTLITLLLVVAVMAVLSAILFPRICSGPDTQQPCTSDNCQMYQTDGDV